MRLTWYEIDAIKNCFTPVFSAGQIYLFGSRTDDTEKGGDIDLYLKLNDTTNWHEKIKFLANLKSTIGDQKIDVIIFNVGDVVVGINDIFNRSVDLIKIYHKIKDFCSERFNLVL